jgi:hypothetical protein
MLNAKGVSRRGAILPLRVQNGPNNQKFLLISGLLRQCAVLLRVPRAERAFSGQTLITDAVCCRRKKSDQRDASARR